MVNRRQIFEKAFHDCMAEMYAKAQPEADWDNLIAEYKAGKIGKDERVYERHYLSKEEFDYILDKYKDAYEFRAHWREYVGIVEDYLKDGGMKDKYIPEKSDEDGFTHPGYRSYEKVDPLKKQINDYLLSKLGLRNGETEKMTEDLTKMVMGNISNCKEFFLFDREENDFSCAIALGPSPTSNPETVKQWWKENYDQDIEIEEHNPILFWYRDMNYTEEDLEDEFGENWKEETDKMWEEKKEAERKEHERMIREFEERYGKPTGHPDPVGEKGADAKEVLSKNKMEELTRE